MGRHMLGLQHQIEGYIHTVAADKTQDIYSKTYLSKIDKTKILMINGNLMKVKSIAECSLLQYF